MAASAAALLAGCADASRFSSDPFSDPFGGAPKPARVSKAYDSQPTGTIPAPRAAAAAPRPTAVSTAAASTPPAGYGHWTAEGGTPITLADGETVAIVANRYGVPADVLMRVNGYSPSSPVPTGAQLIIPVYRAAATPAKAAPAAAAPQAIATAAPKPERAAEAKHEKAAQAEPRKGKEKIAQREEDKPSAKAPAAKPEPRKAKEKAAKRQEVGEDHKSPASKAQDKLAKVELTKPRPQQQAITREPAVKPQERDQKVATIAPPAQPQAQKTAPAPEKEEKVSDAAHPEFRWPARGRVIQCFSCGGNDGINIAVPEGTQVKAAESGVVAYAGSELKGYGNLVLIRHPNGFVTAYAHNGELNVKRGDQVTRGQTIAKSGQTGNVSSPQLHFEVRKGSTPVDPTSYLAGG